MRLPMRALWLALAAGPLSAQNQAIQRAINVDGGVGLPFAIQ